MLPASHIPAGEGGRLMWSGILPSCGGWGKVGAGLLLLSTGGSVGIDDTRNINISHYTPVSSADIHTHDRPEERGETVG